MKKDKNKNNGTAIWINEIGSIRPRVFNIVKENKEKKTVVISFGQKEFYEIPKLNIRAKRVIIYQKSDGSILCQNPDKIGNIDLDAIGIKTLRFNLQNSALQESKAAIWRWTIPQSAVDKLGPIFKLMFICIAIGVLGWAAMKLAGIALSAVASSRLMDCSQLIPKIPDPIGAIINATTPIAA